MSLSTGAVCHARIEKTKDEKDYKVVFHKARKPRTPDMAPSEEEGRGGEVRDTVGRKDDALTLQAAEVVSRFHKLFHGADKGFPTSKELDQAVTLIANHGFEKAKYLVDFSRGAAAQTNYKPQTFGGIVQYTTRALAEMERCGRERRITAAVTAREEAGLRQDEESRKQIDERLSRLSKDEYTELYERIRREFGSKYPDLTAVRGSLFETAIKARMARELEELESRPT